MRVLIVADDLTGALDAAAPFSAAGLRTIVAPFPRDIAKALDARPDVLAVNSDSRDLSAGAAGDAVASLLAEVPDGAVEIVFKKIDSRLQGHPALEATAVAHHFGRASLLVAPAIPELGRVVVDRRITGHGVGAPLEIGAAFAAAGMPFEICDASSSSDMTMIAKRLSTGSDAPLAVGASGLARAVATLLRDDRNDVVAPMLNGPTLFAIGSRDPVTMEQVAQLRAKAPAIQAVLCTDGEWRMAAAVSLKQDILAMMVGGRRQRPPGAAGAEFGAGVAGLLKAGFSGTLLATGGNTMTAILKSLESGPLLLAGEWRPGLPVSIPLSGPANISFVSKSGGFGQPGCLSDLSGMRIGSEN